MDKASQVLDPIQTPVSVRRSPARRVITMLALVSLLGAALVIARDAGSPAVRDKATVAAEVSAVNPSDVGAPATLTAQFFPPIQAIIQAIVCPILNALAGLPFVGPVINTLRILFGCISP